ncbi:MAG: hypothetical protein ACYSUI_09430 [Planctomycetota bacterium]|jgi:hypothetical protein
MMTNHVQMVLLFGLAVVMAVGLAVGSAGNASSKDPREWPAEMRSVSDEASISDSSEAPAEPRGAPPFDEAISRAVTLVDQTGPVVFNEAISRAVTVVDLGVVFNEAISRAATVADLGVVFNEAISRAATVADLSVVFNEAHSRAFTILGPPCDCADPGCVCGACCLPPVQSGCGITPPDPDCIVAPADFCNTFGGTYVGDDTECEQEVFVVHHTATQWSHEFVTVSTCPGSGRGGGCVEGPAAIDAWVTAEGMGVSNCEDFGHPDACPIPAGFFGSGSDPFMGTVCFRGAPLGLVDLPGFPPGLDFGDADTLVWRLDDPFDRCDPPSANPVTVDIAVERLSLVSCDPITVTFNGGQTSEQWDVRVEVLDSSGQPPGSTLTATRDHCNGGTFDSQLAVCPSFVFTKVGDPGMVLPLDFCASCDPAGIQMAVSGVPWVSDPGENVDLVSPVCSDFHPGPPGGGGGRPGHRV